MSDLAMTAPVPGSNAQTFTVPAGATIAAGKAVYLNQSTGLYSLCVATTALGAAAQVAGIAVTSAIAGQDVLVMYSGDLVTGGTVAPGVIYQVSGTAGGIAPTADATTGWFAGVVGHGLDAATLRLCISPSSVTTAKA